MSDGVINWIGEQRKEPRRLTGDLVTELEEPFKTHEMIIYSKEQQKNISREEFFSAIPTGYEGLVFEERSKDPIGMSGR